MARVRLRVLGGLAMVLAGSALAGSRLVEARGNWGGGVYIGVVPPVYVRPPVVISPYPHPRPYYPPPPYYARPAATEGCYAGPYVCPLEGPSVVGMPCSCPTVQGPAWGRAR